MDISELPVVVDRAPRYRVGDLNRMKRAELDDLLSGGGAFFIEALGKDIGVLMGVETYAELRAAATEGIS